MLDNPLTFSRICDDGQNFWFSEFAYNALFKVRKKDWHVELKGIFPNEIFAQKDLYSSVAMCNEKLFFSPQYADEIAEYDLKCGTFRKIPVPVPPLNDKFPLWKYGKFYNVAAIGDKVYFLPNRYPGILCYDTLTDSFSCFDDWVDGIEEIRTSRWYYFYEFALLEGKLILPCVCADAIVVFDSIFQRTQIIRTPVTGHQCKICDICRVGDFFYVLSGDGTVLKRKLDLGEEGEKVFPLPALGTEVIEFHPLQFQDDFIYLFPSGKNKGLKIDTKTDQILEEDLLEGEGDFKGPNLSFFTSLCCDGKIYSVTGNSFRLIEYDFANGTKREIKLFSSESDRILLQKSRQRDFMRRSSEEYVTEDDKDSLEYMLGSLKTYDNANSAADCKKTSVGNKIYDTVKY